MFKLLYSLVILVFALSFQVAHACSCRTGGYWVSEFLEDKVVFEGQVLQTKWLNEDAKARSFNNNAETSFKITKTFQGQVSSQTLIQHHSQGPACGMFYIMGNETLVIAYTNKTGIMSTSSCTSNAVPESTLLDYFEKNIDIYIPSHWDCPEEQINNKDDPKNCHFWSDEAEAERRKTMGERWRKKREKALEKSSKSK